MRSQHFLLWAQCLMVWAAINYTVLDPSIGQSSPAVGRSQTHIPLRLVPSILAAAILWWLASSVAVGAVFMGCAIPLVLLRNLRPGWHMAEREILVSALFSSGSAVLVTTAGLRIQRHLWTLPVANQRIAVASAIVALLAFTIHGGTYIVRGILKAAGVPKSEATPEPSEIDLKRGLWIGALERGLLFVVLIAGSYEALGFIVAAKGLIRSRDFDGVHSRDLTEYFLIGSLASVAVAVATGATARYLLQHYW